MGSYSQGRQQSGSSFAPSRDAGTNLQVKQVVIQAQAVANQDVIAYLPEGASLVDVILDAVTLPTGATSTIAGGTAVGGSQLFGPTDVIASPRTRPTFTAAQLTAMAALPHVSGQSDTPIYLRNAQTTPTAVGKIVVSLIYQQNLD